MSPVGARGVLEGHNRNSGVKESAKASSSKFLPFRKDHTQNIFVWLVKEDEEDPMGVGELHCAEERLLGHTGRQD